MYIYLPLPLVVNDLSLKGKSVSKKLFKLFCCVPEAFDGMKIENVQEMYCRSVPNFLIHNYIITPIT